MKKIDIEFNGYEWDTFSFPHTNGIYGIYSTSKNENAKYIVDELVYVGISNNLDKRVKEHSNSDYPSKDKYCYIYSELTENQSKLAEAAIVNECKPSGNSEYVDEYPKNFGDVQLNISGKHKSIPSNIKRP